MIGSKYLIFVDEAGSPNGTDKNFPVFVLSFVVISKEEYAKKLLPLFCELKLKYFNHTHIVFHERDIRKEKECFAILRNPNIRKQFMQDMNELISKIDFKIISVISDRGIGAKNLYSNTVKRALFLLDIYLSKVDKMEHNTPIVFESREKKEDKDLLNEIKSSVYYNNFEFLCSAKSSNGYGIQLADLTARPIGRNHIDKLQKNRAFDIISKKIFASIVVNNDKSKVDFGDSSVVEFSTKVFDLMDEI